MWNTERKVADEDSTGKVLNRSLLLKRLFFFLFSLNRILLLYLFLWLLFLLYLLFFFLLLLLFWLLLKLMSKEALLIDWEIEDNGSALISGLIELFDSLLAWAIVFVFNESKATVTFAIVRICWYLQIFNFSEGSEEFAEMFVGDVEYKVTDDESITFSLAACLCLWFCFFSRYILLFLLG